MKKENAVKAADLVAHLRKINHAKNMLGSDGLSLSNIEKMTSEAFYPIYVKVRSAAFELVVNLLHDEADKYEQEIEKL